MGGNDEDPKADEIPTYDARDDDQTINFGAKIVKIYKMSTYA